MICPRNRGRIHNNYEYDQRGERDSECILARRLSTDPSCYVQHPPSLPAERIALGLSGTQATHPHNKKSTASRVRLVHLSTTRKLQSLTNHGSTPHNQKTPVDTGNSTVHRTSKSLSLFHNASSRSPYPRPLSLSCPLEKPARDVCFHASLHDKHPSPALYNFLPPPLKPPRAIHHL